MGREGMSSRAAIALRLDAPGVVAGLLAIVGLAPMAQGQVAGTVSLWSGEGDTTDGVGSNDGTAQDTVAYTQGVVGDAFLLQSNGYISVPDPVAGGLELTSGFTVAAWIREDTFDFLAQPVANLRTTGNSSGFSLEHYFNSSDIFVLYVNVAGYGWAGLYSSGWQTGVTYHIAASFDAATGTMSMYRDGVLVASGNAPPAPMTANADSEFQIGRNIVLGSLWNGMIDEVHVIDHAVSLAELDCLVTGNCCPADMNGDGQLNIFDFLAFQSAFSNEDPAADLAAPFGTFNIFDFLAFQTAFGDGC